MKRIIFTYSLTVILLISSVPLFAQTKVDKRFVGIEAEINKILKDNHAAGVAVAVVEKNKVIFAKGFGYRDVENKLPVTANTQFAIGSCTKAFTASVLGILQKEKSIDFDKPVTTYLPDLKFYTSDLTNHITLRDMMSHRTGLPRHDLSWYIAPDTRDNLVKRIQYMEPSAELRQTWQYNNFMYLLQGVVGEKLTGKSWESNVESKIFARIGMNNSNFSVKDLANYKEPALGYNVIKDSVIHKTPYYDIAGMGPAGSINSTVMDMSQWLKVWINGGKLDTVEIIPASYITEAISSQMIMAPGTPTTEKPDIQFSNYGFAWMMASYKGHYRVEHGGNIDGFSASTSFFPSDSIGIVVLVNQNGSSVTSAVRNTITDRVLGLKKGADDYLTKPFNIEELMLRIHNLISRKEDTTKSDALSEYTFGPNIINFDSYEAHGKEGKFSLTKKEALLLKLLIENRDEVVSREKILQTVWGYSVYPSTRTIDNFILAFRKYFEVDPKNPKYFLSLRGVGYKFTT